MKLKKLPVGIQSFRKIKEGAYLYVDKTKYIYKLITENDYIFFSRPRRFGKSLLISTLNEIFKGNKELFKGLWIYDSDYNWTKFPVIKLDMSGVSTSNLNAMISDLIYHLKSIIDDLQIDVDASNTCTQLFDALIKKSYKKYRRKVVILIDEYDAPIISSLENTKKALKIRDILQNFTASLNLTTNT